MAMAKESMESLEVVIERAILEGVLQPGQSVTEDWLCKHLGVSRTPIREALIRLDSAGLVKIVKNKGAFIREITPLDISEIFELRILLESHAAQICVDLVDQNALADLRDKFQDAACREDGDQEKIELGAELHDLIAKSSANRRLKDLVAMLKTQISWVRSFATKVPGRVERSFQEHQDLLEALANRDGERAGKAMQAHLIRTRDEMLDPANMRLYTKVAS